MFLLEITFNFVGKDIPIFFTHPRQPVIQCRDSTTEKLSQTYKCVTSYIPLKKREIDDYLYIRTNVNNAASNYFSDLLWNVNSIKLFFRFVMKCDLLLLNDRPDPPQWKPIIFHFSNFLIWHSKFYHKVFSKRNFCVDEKVYSRRKNIYNTLHFFLKRPSIFLIFCL